MLLIGERSEHDRAERLGVPRRGGCDLDERCNAARVVAGAGALELGVVVRADHDPALGHATDDDADDVRGFNGAVLRCVGECELAVVEAQFEHELPRRDSADDDARYRQRPTREVGWQRGRVELSGVPADQLPRGVADHHGTAHAAPDQVREHEVRVDRVEHGDRSLQGDAARLEPTDLLVRPKLAEIDAGACDRTGGGELEPDRGQVGVAGADDEACGLRLVPEHEDRFLPNRLQPCPLERPDNGPSCVPLPLRADEPGSVRADEPYVALERGGRDGKDRDGVQRSSFRCRSSRAARRRPTLAGVRQY